MSNEDTTAKGKTEKIIKFLKDFAENGDDWEKKAVNLPSGKVAFQKTASGKIALTINSVDYPARHDKYIYSKEQLVDFYSILTDNLKKLMLASACVSAVNGKTPSKANVSKDAIDL